MIASVSYSTGTDDQAPFPCRTGRVRQFPAGIAGCPAGTSVPVYSLIDTSVKKKGSAFTAR
jgi:hypothetical protein